MVCGSFLLTLFCDELMILFRAKPFTNAVQREVASRDLHVPNLATPYSVHQNGNTTIAAKSARKNNKISRVVPVADSYALSVLVQLFTQIRVSSKGMIGADFPALQSGPPTHCSFSATTDDFHKSKSIDNNEW